MLKLGRWNRRSWCHDHPHKELGKKWTSKEPCNRWWYRYDNGTGKINRYHLKSNQPKPKSIDKEPEMKFEPHRNFNNFNISSDQEKSLMNRGTLKCATPRYCSRKLCGVKKWAGVAIVAKKPTRRAGRRECKTNAVQSQSHHLHLSQFIFTP